MTRPQVKTSKMSRIHRKKSRLAPLSRKRPDFFNSPLGLHLHFDGQSAEALAGAGEPE
jgi:hypothetical protein